jgi:hypothetical protein
MTPRLNPELNDEFPEVVLRGAARLNPALKAYYGTLPKNTRHYGGYYTLTDENWPLVAPWPLAMRMWWAHCQVLVRWPHAPVVSYVPNTF